MMPSPKEEYLTWLLSVRRYSPRTVEIYSDVLDRFVKYCKCDWDSVTQYLVPATVRSWEVSLSEDENLSPKTVCLHLSVLSGFCRHLCAEGRLDSNPVSRLKRPRLPRRIPKMFRRESMDRYFEDTARYADPDFVRSWYGAEGGIGTKAVKEFYDACLRRLIISILYQTAVRRAELISLRVKDFDPSRRTLTVTGKGDKMREIPITDSLCGEILLYLELVERLLGGSSEVSRPLLVTSTSAALYPSAVDRAVKKELSGAEGISGRKSPHVLRHTIATELLEDGTSLESIKEFLGHSSLAATQVYTHASIAQLSKIYKSAHPRAKKQ